MIPISVSIGVSVFVRVCVMMVIEPGEIEFGFELYTGLEDLLYVVVELWGCRDIQ